MAHDIPTLAYHEAGHAVFVAASPWAQKLSSVWITPNEAAGGGTKLNDHTGKCPKDEIPLEYGKALAGPLAQIIHWPDAISQPYRDQFAEALLPRIEAAGASLDAINALMLAANTQPWGNDLSKFLGMFLKTEWPPKLREPDLQLHRTVEGNLRIWFRRTVVAACIHSVASALMRSGKLSGNEVLGLCGALEVGDRISSEILAQ